MALDLHAARDRISTLVLAAESEDEQMVRSLSDIFMEELSLMHDQAYLDGYQRALLDGGLLIG